MAAFEAGVLKAHARRFEVEVDERRARAGEREESGAHVVGEAGQGELFGAERAAGAFWVRLEDEDAVSQTREDVCGDEAVWTGAHDDHVGIDHASGILAKVRAGRPPTARRLHPGGRSEKNMNQLRHIVPALLVALPLACSKDKAAENPEPYVAPAASEAPANVEPKYMPPPPQNDPNTVQPSGPAGPAPGPMPLQKQGPEKAQTGGAGGMGGMAGGGMAGGGMAGGGSSSRHGNVGGTGGASGEGGMGGGGSTGRAIRR